MLVDVSKPDFDPNTIKDDWDALNTEGSNSPLLNRALQGLYPPGSTFKIVTTLAYLRQYGTLEGFSLTVRENLPTEPIRFIVQAMQYTVSKIWHRHLPIPATVPLLRLGLIWIKISLLPWQES